ncbi:MAG TPA: cytochrome P450 [Thermoleophilaceae bacterium]|nr:cytochrome P450 [Thermoleophilaceae bacterium]
MATAPTLAPPRGPRLPVLLQSYLALQWLVPYSRWARRRYGDVFTMKLVPLGRVLAIGDPALIKEVLTGPPEVFHAGDSNRRFLQPVLGSRGVLVLDGDDHMATRKRLLPAFHGEAIRRYEQVIREETERRIAHWPVGRPIRMDRETRAITLEVIMRTVFGAGESPKLAELRAVLGRITHVTFVRSLWYVAPALALVPPWRGYARSVSRANTLVGELIRDRRAAPDLDERDDVLSMLVRDAEDDEQWLRDQVMNLLAAGHETTTTGLAWAMELLARHPDVRAKARDGDDAYLDAVVTETLRIRPVIPGATRRLTEPATIGPYRVPAGVTLLPMASSVHMDPRVYDEPEQFRPERFVNERPGTYSWFPFGGGRRRCVGAAFAQTEMRVALRTILDRTDWEPAGRRPERQRNFHITLVPSRGARVVRTR